MEDVFLGGFRRGELTALEWSDIDFENNTITIRKSLALTKNGQAVVKDPKTEESFRTVDMPLWYMEELKIYYREWIKEKLKLGDMWQGEDHQYVFHGGFGKPYYFTVPTEQWKRISKRHGLKQIRLHDLRHTAGTLLIEAGLAQGIDTDITLKAVQERLGHKDFKTTADIYTHVTKKASKALAEQLDKFDPKNFVNKSSITAK
ncbi:site-specific integrase [Fodinisporobacter ferrooxydans]|uniref:Site-specific integrase n=1 Tax=Fodinisporobacter ferrooxydans TaxID=2901836 RepID=A0ABY4CP86_9BACL|nr:site-specific integrase [Alicyclobacillaceae bacterium MYW30-H2]